MLLASCSLDEAKKYNNKLVVVSEKETKKPEKVFLNVVVSDAEDAFKNNTDAIKCITILGDCVLGQDDVGGNPKFCPDTWKGNVFLKIPFEYIQNGTVKIPNTVDGVSVLVQIDDEDNYNMQELYTICQKYPNVRFIGGNLLEIPGMKIGRYDEGKEKMSSVFNGVYDAFEEVKLANINVHEIMPKIRAKSSSSGPKKARVGGAKKAPSKPKKVLSFEKFFTEEDEF